MTVRIQDNLPFWNKFPPDIKPPNAKRGYLRPSLDSMFVVIRTGPGCFNDPREIPLENLNSSALELPSSRLDLNALYCSYRERVIPADSDYGKMIDILAVEVVRKIREENLNPDAFVAIPTRKEVNTSRACDVIQKDFVGSGLVPFILVLHNDIELPDAGTTHDLSKIRDNPMCAVIDMQFSQDSTIGDARAIASDVIIEVSNRLSKFTPMVIADADVTRVKHGTYKAITDPIREDTDTDLVSPLLLPDISTIKSDQTYAAIEEARIIFIEEFLKYLSIPFFAGGSAGINPKSYLAVGGFPRLNLGEDLFFSLKFCSKLNQEPVLTLYSNAAVYLDATRHAASYRAETAKQAIFGQRYENWCEGANLPRPQITNYELDKKVVIGELNTFISGLTHNIFREINPNDYEKMTSSVYLRLEELCNRLGLPIGERDEEVKLGSLLIMTDKTTDIGS